MTEDEFYQLLDRRTSWRRQELRVLLNAVPSMKHSSQASAIRRGAVVVSYAHWEGFVRDSGKIFLKFVDSKNVSINDLKRNFVALLNPDGHEVSFRVAKVRLFQKNGIMDSKKLRRIVWQLGLEYLPFESKDLLIQSLVKTRNSIAHGEDTQISIQSFEQHARSVLDLVQIFRDQIDKSVKDQGYLENYPR